MEPALSTPRKGVSVIMALVLMPLLFAEVPETHAQGAPEDSVGTAMVNAPEAKPIVSARPAKERVAVFVLLAWLWLSIAVLLGLLRLRVREADRVFRMGLDLSRRGRPGQN
jgi:hypothetical protein